MFENLAAVASLMWWTTLTGAQVPHADDTEPEFDAAAWAVPDEKSAKRRTSNLLRGDKR